MRFDVHKLTAFGAEHNLTFTRLDSVALSIVRRHDLPRNVRQFLGSAGFSQLDPFASKLFPRLTKLKLALRGAHTMLWTIPCADIFKNISHLELMAEAPIKICCGWTESECALRNLENLVIECLFADKSHVLRFASTLSSLLALEIRGIAATVGVELLQGLRQAEAPLKTFGYHYGWWHVEMPDIVQVRTLYGQFCSYTSIHSKFVTFWTME